MKLKPSKVEFDEIEHSYTYKGKPLSGVTALLKRQLFEGKYDGVSKAFLAEAAERGNSIHRQIEMFESFGGEEYDREVFDYVRLKDSFGFSTLATEWLVSDNENVASSIDVVYQKDKELFLCDIKTTSRLDMEYLSWQLSIYKYLLLLDNPKVKIGGLCACWLPRERYGKPKMVVVAEKPMEWVKELIAADARGEKWVNPEAPAVADEAPLSVPQEITVAIANLLRAERAAKDMKEQLKVLMEEHGIKRWECDDFVATYVPPGKSKGFDKKRFESDHPDIYEQYVVESERKSSIRTALR